MEMVFRAVIGKLAHRRGVARLLPVPSHGLKSSSMYGNMVLCPSPVTLQCSVSGAHLTRESGGGPGQFGAAECSVKSGGFVQRSAMSDIAVSCPEYWMVAASS